MATKYDLCERLMAEGLDGFDGRMSATDQRRIFGRPLFGKKRIQVSCDGQGEIRASWSAAFGTTTAGSTFTFDEVAHYMDRPGEPVRF